MKRLRFFSTSQEVLFLLMHPWIVFRERLSEDNLHSNPFDQFRLWYNRARYSLTTEFPNAMCLSTTTPDGCPDSRMVLLKKFDERGVVFYTNLNSEKGKALLHDPRASVTFYWGPSQRQIRIQGTVEPVSDEEADAYFASRPRRSQLGAWASLQSEVLESREILDCRFREFAEMFRDKPVPRPEHWSGFRIVPRRFEFWQLRLNRLHDRFAYTLENDGRWKIERLFP